MNKEIISKAIEMGKGNWWNLFGPYLLFYVILCGCALLNFIPIVGLLAYVFLAFLLGCGYNMYCYNLYNGKHSLKDLFCGFKNKNIGRWTKFLLWFVLIIGGFVLVLTLLMMIPFVGPFLYIIGFIPYMILCFGISQSTWILFEEPELKTIDILKKSWNLMKGHKWRYFWLSLKICLVPLILVLVGYVMIMYTVVAASVEATVTAGIIGAIGLIPLLAGLV